MPKKLPDSRSLLRAAITSRKAAHQHREEAAGALLNADTVLSAATAERDAAQHALAQAEADNAAAIAKAIKDGEKPDTKITATIRTAQDAVAESESRHRMSKQARDQIADELSRASAEVVEAEMAVTRAADSVITSEIESRCNLGRINAAIATLIEVDEKVFGLGYLWMGGKPLNPSETLQAIFARLEPLRNAVAQMRPERPILSPPPEQTTARRLESYRTALTQNADAQLKNIAKPVWEPPKPMSQNIILREREALRTRIAAAAG